MGTSTMWDGTGKEKVGEAREEDSREDLAKDIQGREDLGKEALGISTKVGMAKEATQDIQGPQFPTATATIAAGQDIQQPGAQN